MRLLTEKNCLRNLLLVVAIKLALLQVAAAGQGCPFDDGSCQEYCNQQGCNMGYCGHFAWIQCICRKCGDEWSWYDKVRYNPDKTVNQTELDSLKLNNTNALILTNSSAGQPTAQPLGAASNGSASTSQQAAETGPVRPQTQKATLTTLLIPDLSDNGRLDLNDIPDENSDKFLDYLAKNHEKLVQATSAHDSSRTSQQQPGDRKSEDEGDEEPDEEQSSSPVSAGDERADDDTIEIQISTSNNNTKSEQQPIKTESTGGSQEAKSPITRLLKMAVMEESD